MNYWQGYMDWPVRKDWVCVLCGVNAGLEWGMVHAQCRCNNCHTQYMMRDGTKDDRPIVDIPISMLKDEYKQPAKTLWEKLHTPMDTWQDVDWEEALKAGEK